MEDSTTTVVGHSCRVLTEEETKKLRCDSETVSEFRQTKLENEAGKNWDKFYKRNNVNFFKDRHWTKEEFQQICPDVDWQGSLKILEAGCGVGNFLFPFLESFPNVFFYACDFSHRAIKFIQENSNYNPDRCHAFVCDLTLENSNLLLDNVSAESVDVCTFIFVLSAIHPNKMVLALKNVHKDGTRAYYFAEEKLKELFEQAGFETSFCQYVQKETINKKENLCVPRIFIQGRFKKKGFP